MGAFGYWDKYSTTYDKYQPYAIETFQMALPFADDKEATVEGISNGLEALYRMDLETHQYDCTPTAFLAPGYEVTTRIRYETDRLLNRILSPGTLKSLGLNSKNWITLQLLIGRHQK